MNGYLCPACKGITTDPTRLRIRNPGESDWDVLESCPDCGHDQLDEAAVCIDCQQAETELDDYCAECAPKHFDAEQIADFRRDGIQVVRPLLRDPVDEAIRDGMRTLAKQGGIT